MARPSKFFDTLDDALETLVQTPQRSRPLLVAFDRVRVRDAAAAAVLVELSKRETNRKTPHLKPYQLTEVTNEGAINHLIAAVALLDFLDRALLPALLKDPCTNQPYLEALVDCVKKLRTEAAGVGGNFAAEADSFCVLADNYYKCVPVQMPSGLMEDAVRKMVARVKTLLESTANFR